MPVEAILFKRDCEATQIPTGTRVMIPKGTGGRITQSLGGSYTVVTDLGYMVRVEGENADAVGKPVPESAKAADQNLPLDKLVWNQLRTIYDPEIPINIAELGLIYEMKITPLTDTEGVEGSEVNIKMTLTAPGCGMGDALKRDAQNKIEKLPGVKRVNIELVWEPVWNQSMMSEAAKLQLGL